MSVDDEAACACSDGGEISGGGGCFAKDDIGAAGVGTCGRIAAIGTNEEISEAIAVDITGSGDAVAAAVESGLAIDDEAAAAISDGGEVNR